MSEPAHAFNDRERPIATISRPPLPRSYSTPLRQKNTSLESLRLPRTSRPLPPLSIPPLLRKRHSTNVLSLSPPDRDKTPVPVPGLPPSRPLRNPARAVSTTQTTLSRTKSKSSTRTNSRPSTASSARAEITPWEFAPGPATSNDDQLLSSPVTSPITSASRSPVSSRPRKSLTTGPLSEVTPWELYPVQRSATSRSSLTSGFIEEVTPWELHPVPTNVPSRSTLATGPVEDVTPWELVPTPLSTEPPIPPISEKRFSTRLSTSQSKPDIPHVRRRKSTSAKATKTRPFFGHSLHTSGDPSNSEHGRANSSAKAPKLTHTTSSYPALPPLAPFPTISNEKPPTSPPDLRFSTADRTILEELKRNLKARDAQFVMKGEGSSLVSPLGTLRGKKHHAYLKEEVPYPRSYGREVIDLDVWETASCQDICESLTWHVFESPPTKVLDLGCGTGTWILNCAKAWKNCHFVGLDLVPLQPDLQQVGSPDLATRITWVHHNFLEGLPFPDDEFDFVHIKRIALGVPEDKWDTLFEEISRVMKPGGAFEMLEEDLFFPGKLDVDDDSDDTDSEKRSPLLSSHHHTSQSRSDINLDSLADSGPPSFKSDDASLSTPTTSVLPATPSRPNSPTAQITVGGDEEKEEAQDLLAQVMGDFFMSSEGVSTQANANFDTLFPTNTGGNLTVKSPKSPFASSATSLGLTSVGSIASSEETNTTPDAQTPSQGLSLAASLTIPDIKMRSHATEVRPKITSVPLLLRTVQKPPLNPRDHSLLEAIYLRLLESRFINTSPLALLANYVGLYFKDVRTHPPLQYHFPAAQSKRRFDPVRMDGIDNSQRELSNFDSDDARDAIVPSPVSRTAKKEDSRHAFTQNHEEGYVDENRYVGVHNLVQHSSPYITIDESRASALSPSIKGMFPDISSARLQRGYFLPNTTMHLDLKTLNLHLALRAAEIVACSESMWEWVQERKAREARERGVPVATMVREHRSGSNSIEMPRRSNVSAANSRDSSDSFDNAILDLTREEFDALVSRFELDMRDKCAVNDALKGRFSWHLADKSVSHERELFETACEKWDRWEQEKRDYRSSYHHRRRQPPSGTHTAPHLSPITLEDNNQKAASQSNGLVISPTRRISRAIRVIVAWKAGDLS